MDQQTELDWLRDRCDAQSHQIEVLTEHLEKARIETERLTALVTKLERVCDERAGEIARLNQVVAANY